MPTPPSKDERDRVRSWVKKAISFYRTAGREISLAEFMNPRGQFVRSDLYIFAIDLDGIMLAHPINERFAGKNFLDFCDSGGRGFIREIVENAKRNGSGLAEYKWYHPASREELLKTIYYEEIDGLIVCSGFYHSEEDHFERSFKSKEHYPENFFELLEYLGA